MPSRLPPALLLAVALTNAAAQSPDATAPAARPLPDWLEVGAEWRARFESRLNLGLQAERDDDVGLSRLRLSVGVKPNERLRFFVQAEDSRAGGFRPDRNRLGSVGPWDLRQAYVEIGGSDDDWWKLRVGRQLVSLGGERVFGARRWANIMPTWDAARLTLGTKTDKVDLLSMAQVGNRPGAFDSPFGAGNVHGAYGSLGSVVPGATFEPYWVFWTQPRIGATTDARPGADSHTFGFRLDGKLDGPFGYEVEIAGQRGDSPDRDLRAWMGNWRLRFHPRELPWDSDFHAMFEFASGDDDPTDSRVNTYDSLFQSRHLHLGRIDVVGRRNLKSLKFGWEAEPTASLFVRAEHYNFWVASKRDAMYAPSGALAVAAPPGGAASAYLGEEIHFSIRYRPTSTMSIETGVGRFFRGGFIKEALPASSNQTLLYIELGVSLRSGRR